MKLLIIVVFILIFIVILLISYIIFNKLQLRSINKQLNDRITEETQQPISLELQNKTLNNLVASINRWFKAEDTLRLNRASEEKRFKELIANISHDLRTPITAIMGYLQLMEKSELSQSQLEKLLIAKKHTEELGDLVQNFFQYSCLLASEQKPNFEKVNITNIVTECIVAVIPAFEEKKLLIKLEKIEPVFVLADKEMVVRIIQNLLRNCLAHSSGDIEVNILETDKATITVANHIKEGSQIDVNRIFERFYTSDNARSNSTGLGLSIVSILVNNMGGNVEADLKGNILKIEVKLPIFKKARREPYNRKNLSRTR